MSNGAKGIFIGVITGIIVVLLAGLIGYYGFVKPKLGDKIDLAPPSRSAEKEAAEQEPAEEETDTQSEYPKLMYVNTEDGLLLRKGPGKENDVIGSLSYGQKIKVEKIEGGWAYTTVDGVSGWCSAEYLTEDKSATENN